MNRPKRVFQLRKTTTGGIKPPAAREEESRTPVEQNEEEVQNPSQIIHNNESSIPAGLPHQQNKMGQS